MKLFLPRKPCFTNGARQSGGAKQPPQARQYLTNLFFLF